MNKYIPYPQNLQFSQQNFLGSGGFSTVYKVYINKIPYALKKMHPCLMLQESTRSQILREINIMSNLSHPNILPLISYYHPSQSQLSLLLQYAPCSSLYNLLQTHHTLSQQSMLNILRQIVRAVKYLHQRQQPILHRDIKPENILLMGDGRIKLADFGASNLLDKGRYSFVGTKQYMAPEIQANILYGKAIDMWCIGLLVYQVLIGKLPNENQPIYIPKKISRAAQDVIKRLLNKNPQRRMTLKELQNHIWLAEQEDVIKQQKMDIVLNDSQKKLQRIKQKKVNQKLNFDISNRQQPLLIKPPTPPYQCYMSILQYKTSLKILSQTQNNLINRFICSIQRQNSFLIQQINRLQTKKQQYEKNINLLKQQPVKFVYKVGDTYQSLLVRIQKLYEFLQQLPGQLVDVVQIQQTTDIKNNLTIQCSDNIEKLYIQILQQKRNALLDLIAQNKIYQTLNMQNTLNLQNTQK